MTEKMKCVSILIFRSCLAVKLLIMYSQLSISQSCSSFKLLISQSNYSDPRTCTLRYQYFEKKEVKMKIRAGNTLIQ